ncbi:Tn3 family transposase [Bacillus swezeyi]|uniref:Tn3 family transposase n=1 Tax=Bacillus swezeyi TaxID=1925020 RepID=UPI0038513CA3
MAHSIREGKLGFYTRQNKPCHGTQRDGMNRKVDLHPRLYLKRVDARRRIQSVLNKEKAMNALARAIFFRKHGELRERALQDQLQLKAKLKGMSPVQYGFMPELPKK